MLTKLVKSAIIKYINHNQTKMGVVIDTGIKMSGIINVDVMLDLPSIIKLIESNSNDKQIFSVRFA